MNTPPSPSFPSRSHIFTVIFFAIFLFLLYEMLRLLAPFSSALVWAAILALALYPVYRRVVALMKGRRGPAAAVMTLFTLILIVGPSIALLAALAAQAVALYQWISEMILSGKLADLWSRILSPFFEKALSHPYLAGLDIKGIIIKGISEFSSAMASQVGNVLKNTALLALNLVIMLVSLFFFFRDGETYYTSAMKHLPFTGGQKESISRKFRDTFSAVINGVFLIALIQGIMTGVGFVIFGVSFPVFWGFLAAVLALLPVGGSALVWIPGALYLFVTGAKLQGILLAVWGLVLVSTPDNFLKPLLIGKKAQLPTFFLFIGILGGLKVFGFLGIIFGPIVVTLLTAFAQIYREEFAER